jgi:predicted PurR-regulated permease PerM
MMFTPHRLSYGVLALTIVLAGFVHLGPPLVVVLFSYFALRRLYSLTKRRWLALLLFMIGVLGVAAAAVYFTRAAFRALPAIADTSIPSATAWAEQRQIELPFTDFESLRALLIGALKEEAHYLQGVAHVAGSTVTAVALSIIAIVIAGSLFLKARPGIADTDHSDKTDFYSICLNEISKRFRELYRSFAEVMGAQITISLINTVLTGIFVLAAGLSYAPLLIAITFVCGLVPIVGNLVSNTIIVFVALTASLKLAVAALVFLVVIHKLEYFLNSKIIGERIRNPVWLTLIALIIGERLMGISGLILAPVILNYLRVESSKLEISRTP